MGTDHWLHRLLPEVIPDFDISAKNPFEGNLINIVAWAWSSNVKVSCLFLSGLLELVIQWVLFLKSSELAIAVVWIGDINLSILRHHS